jgi:Wzt C-terminal domain
MDGAPSDVTRAYQQFVVHGSAQPPQPRRARPAVGPQPAVALGAGWYPLEAYGGEVFRWGSPAAELILDSTAEVTGELLLDLGAAPPTPDHDHASLKIVDDADRLLAPVDRTERSIVRAAVHVTPDHPTRVYLRSQGRVRAAGDDRELSVRLFRWGWDDEGAMAPIGQATDWIEAAHDLELNAELASMHRALRRCTAVPNAAARVTRVCTRSGDGLEAVRFSTHDPCALEVTIEALDNLDEPVVGVQVRDAFDRLLWTTRTDWLGAQLPPMTAGQRVTAIFATERLLLGRGLYQITVAVHRYPDEDRVLHWIDGAWRFEVIDSPGLTFKGMFDLGWRHEPVRVVECRASPVLSL